MTALAHQQGHPGRAWIRPRCRFSRDPPSLGPQRLATLRFASTGKARGRTLLRGKRGGLPPAYTPTAKQAHLEDPEKRVEVSRAIEGVPWVRRHFFDEDPDPQRESTEELNVYIEENDPEWQVDLDKLRRAFIAGRATASLPSVPEAPKASGTVG